MKCDAQNASATRVRRDIWVVRGQAVINQSVTRDYAIPVFKAHTLDVSMERPEQPAAGLEHQETDRDSSCAGEDL